jgi:large subunit ribosomal protein L17
MLLKDHLGIFISAEESLKDAGADLGERELGEEAAMRHAVSHRKLGRTSAHRQAMFRNQLASFIEHERIRTTLAKAKELRPLAERLITRGREDTVHARRMVGRYVPDRGLIKKLFEEISPRFSDRPGGYTRIRRELPQTLSAARSARAWRWRAR